MSSKVEKVKVGILGAGTIAADLLMKVRRSDFLECAIVVSRNADSKGIRVAVENDVPVAFNSIQYFLDNPDCCDVVFDATTAKSHFEHAPVLKKLGKFVVDLTPSGVGQICVPVLNADECVECDNVNMITCGGQATIPAIAAIMRVHPETSYIEVVASLASKSVGMGTRENLDEYNQTTKDAAIKLSGAPNVKILAMVNPAKPPVTMHNTIYALIDKPDIAAIKAEVKEVVSTMQGYVPGYKLIMEPIYESDRVTLMIGVEGLGDYLPKFAGNLDIINCAAISIAERYAQKHMDKVRPSLSLAG